MHLDEYVELVRNGVEDAAALADEQSRVVATRLGAALESATRLALIRALSDAASEVSAEVAPASVEVRMAGSEPQFVVSTPAADEAEPTVLLPETEQPEPSEEHDPDEPQSRITLRLPQSVKEKVDTIADAEGISTNAWLVRAVLDALSAAGERRDPWAAGGLGRDALPPIPPAPPNFPFSPGFPPPLRSRGRGGRGGPRGRGPGGGPGGRGPGAGGTSMQGWVR